MLLPPLREGNPVPWRAATGGRSVGVGPRSRLSARGQRFLSRVTDSAVGVGRGGHTVVTDLFHGGPRGFAATRGEPRDEGPGARCHVLGNRTQPCAQAAGSRAPHPADVGHACHHLRPRKHATRRRSASTSAARRHPDSPLRLLWGGLRREVRVGLREGHPGGARPEGSPTPCGPSSWAWLFLLKRDVAAPAREARRGSGRLCFLEESSDGEPVSCVLPSGGAASVCVFTAEPRAPGLG